MPRRIRGTTEIDCPQDLYTKQTFALGLRAIPFILHDPSAARVSLQDMPRECVDRRQVLPMARTV